MVADRRSGASASLSRWIVSGNGHRFERRPAFSTKGYVTLAAGGLPGTNDLRYRECERGPPPGVRSGVREASFRGRPRRGLPLASRASRSKYSITRSIISNSA